METDRASGRPETEPPDRPRPGPPRTGVASPANLRRGASIVLAILVVVYAGMSQLAGTGELVEAWHRLEWHFLTLPLLATMISYVTMSLSYEGIVRAAGASI